MRSERILIALPIVALFAVACASGGAPASTATQASATRGLAVPSRYLVTEQELESVGDRSAYEALQQLRPSFLKSRDVQTESNPIPKPVDVYVDGGQTEGLAALQSIRAGTVKEMRFYEPQQANTKFGTGHNGGVIAVTLK
jgi:hypothetical protein